MADSTNIRQRVCGNFSWKESKQKRAAQTILKHRAGISFHVFLQNRVIRQKWMKFVQKRHVDFKAPTSGPALCS